jgi:hypothetical protein
MEPLGRVEPLLRQDDQSVELRVSLRYRVLIEPLRNDAVDEAIQTDPIASSPQVAARLLLPFLELEHGPWRSSSLAGPAHVVAVDRQLGLELIVAKA